MTLVWISAGSGAAPRPLEAGLAVGRGVAEERLEQCALCPPLPAEQTIS